MGELILREQEHIYEVDGVQIPSVTDIVSPLGNDVDEMLELTIEAAAERGTICHKILEMLLANDVDDNTIEYPSNYEGHVEAIELFLSEHDIKPYVVEVPIYSETLGVAGKPDLLCEFDGELSILDYKFVSQVAKTKVKAQLNGYLKIYNEHGVFPEKLYAVQFASNGSYRLYSVAIDDSEFMLCMALHKAKNKKHKRGQIE